MSEQAPPQNQTAEEAPAQTVSQNAPATDLLVCVDIPDVDNFQMVLSVLKRNPTRRVHIVLSPRPVDFSARWYGTRQEQAALANRLPNWGGLQIPRMLMPYGQVPVWVKEIEDEEIRQTYFERPDLPPIDLLEDTKLYMQVSTYRLINFLSEAGFAQSRFQIYWDEKSLGPGKIQHGLRGCYHTPDYVYDFEPNNMAKALSIAKQNMDPNDRRNELRDLCKGYIASQELKYGMGTKLFNFDDLDGAKNSISTEEPVMVGGPFTELVKLIEKGFRPKLIIAMAGFVDGRGNLFPNQFNIHVDFNSAWKLFSKLAKEHGICIRLLPTEGCKAATKLGADYNYQIPKERFTALFKIATIIGKAVKKLVEVAAKVIGIVEGADPYFDWIAAVMPQIPSAFPLKYVEPWKARREILQDGTVNYRRITEKGISNEQRAVDIVMCFMVIEAFSLLQMWRPVEGDRAQEGKVQNLVLDQFARDFTI